ncbi:endonuclease/exonuclease/phosphatase family protein [Prolixibacteraceae bacterium JC049]|nr:endonuclease/exonuclease/phosphatase family protein [Prolixibacteraceae bacterium JC049]
MKLKWMTSILLVCWAIYGCSKEEPVKWQSEYDISVMSFNLRYDTDEDGENRWSNRKEACVEMLKETNPAVFGIQEGLHHQIEYLKEKLPKYKYAGVARDDGHSSGEYNAVFYSTEQFELLESNTFWLSETPNEPSLGWDGACRRIVTWVKLKDKKKNKTLLVFNTHFDHEGKKARKEAGILLEKKIREIANESAPIFITGDFNALIRNKILQPLVNEYYSARRYAPKTDNTKSFNFYGRWYLSRNIDFIFYKNAEALSFRTVSESYGVPYISDHYPIISHYNY